MRNFLEVRDPSYKKYSKNFGEHTFPDLLLYCFTTRRHSSNSTNSLTKSEFVIASCGAWC